MYNENYDVLFVDFKNGAGDLFKNGNAVIQLIQWVNENKQSEEELIVMGASMGGLIARYALRKMEILQCNHCTRLYGTFDSPHKGANVPLGIQYAARFFKIHSASSLIAYKGLGSKAAQQLLIYNIYPNAHIWRNTWQSWLAKNGHPVIPKRIALTNGHPRGKGDFNEGDALYNYCFQSWVTLLSCNIYAAKPGGIVFEGKIPVSYGAISYLFGLLTQSYFVAAEKVPSGYTYYDHAAGGTAGWALIIRDALEESSRKIPVQNYCPPASIRNMGLSCFVPSFSALDFYLNNRFPDLQQLFPTSSDREKESQLHPFHAIYFHNNANASAKGNQEHVFVDNLIGQNIDWIMSQLSQFETDLSEELPNGAGYSTFNYHQQFTQFASIKSIVIKQGGLLQLNGAYRLGYGRTTDPIPHSTSGTQNFETSRCGSYIKIEQQGALEIGDDNAAYPQNTKAILWLRKGSVLDLGSYGQLIIHNGSKLVIEEGAELIYGDKAQIKLLGENAIIDLRGQIVLSSGSSFTFYGNSSGEVGFIHARVNTSNQGNLFKAGSGSRVFLLGNSNHGDRMLLVDGGVLAIPEGLSEFKVSKAGIDFTGNAGIKALCKVKINQVRLSGIFQTTQNFGIDLSNEKQNEIKNCVFDDLERGLIINSHSQQLSVIEQNTFKDCDIGVELQSGRTLLKSCNFSKCSNGVLLLGHGYADLINCKFSKGEYGLREVNGQQAFNYYFLEDCFFQRLGERPHSG